MTFLDKGGNVRETLGVRSENNALRAVRAKREADEAGELSLSFFSALSIHKLQTRSIGRVYIG